MPDRIDIAAYRPEWREQFLAVAAEISSALGDHAITIHHVGSTSIPGLDAKDIIDVQVSVADLDDPQLRPALEAAGFGWRDDITGDHSPPGTSPQPGDLNKRYAQRWDPPRVNCHIRVPGRLNHRYALLFRDFLRANDRASSAYGDAKRHLADHFPHDVDAYYDVKDPVMDIIFAAAEGWAEATNWTEPVMIPATASDWTLKHRRDRDLFFGHHFASPLPVEARQGFIGLHYFEVDPAWRLEGEFEALTGRSVDVPSTSGVASSYRHVGNVVVAMAGRRQRLIVLDDGDGGRFIPFTDETAGAETYGGARYVAIEHREDATVTVDFNEAHNPWCVYDDEFVCPLAPPQNAIALRVTAGEMDFRP